MAKNFLPCDRDQELLLPPSLREWLPPDHLAWFVIDAVSAIDLAAFYCDYRDDGWGRAAHDPQAMVTLLLYAYALGERSSRRIERRCREDVAFRVIAANRTPDHATIARFRVRHEHALSEVFVEVLRLCQEAGVLAVGVVALDGTKIQADASLGANRSYGFIREQVEAMLCEAADADAKEDAEPARRAVTSSRQSSPSSRLRKLEAARERLEAELAEEHAQHSARIERRAEKQAALAPGRRLQGRDPAPPPAAVAADAKANLTDPDSSTVKSGFRFFQGYNAQAAVAEGQFVVAAELTNETTDRHQLEPMIAATDRMLKAIAHPNAVGITVADAGYWTDRQLAAALAEGRRVLLNPSTSSPLKRPAEQPVKLGRPAPPRIRGLRRLMHALLETQECREVYGRRRELV